jgi:hypothetical protein
MASQSDKQMLAEYLVATIPSAGIAGLRDVDIANAANTAALIAQIRVRYNSGLAAPHLRIIGEALCQGLNQLQVQGVLTDTISSNFLTLRADPFVAGVATDVLSLAATNLPSGVTPNPKQGSPTVFPAFANI